MNSQLHELLVFSLSCASVPVAIHVDDDRVEMMPPILSVCQTTCD